MVRENEVRSGEVTVDPPEARDVELYFIGSIATPWTHRRQCPRQGRQDGPICSITLYEPWIAALHGIERYPLLEILYWLNMSRRDLILQSPANDGSVRGTFALRSPARPNPIGTSIVKQVGREGAVLLVRGLDCLDGTPLLDIKPDRSGFVPLAPPQPGDFEVGDDKA